MRRELPDWKVDGFAEKAKAMKQDLMAEVAGSDTSTEDAMTIATAMVGLLIASTFPPQAFGGAAELFARHALEVAQNAGAYGE
jgi:hypothetical protein